MNTEVSSVCAEWVAVGLPDSGTESVEVWVVGKVWMGVKMGVQSPAVWVLAV